MRGSLLHTLESKDLTTSLQSTGNTLGKQLHQPFSTLLRPKSVKLTFISPTNLHMPKTNLQQQILIEALPSKVWKVLTCSRYIAQYLFEGILECKWTEGSPLTLVTESNGSTQTLHKGKVVQAVPGVLLQYHLQDDSSGCMNTTYEILPAGDAVELKIKCEGFEDNDEEFDMRFHQVNMLLKKIRWLAEYA